MSDTKTVLVIDTAMHGCGAAVYDARIGDGRDVVCDAYSDDPRGQAQVLVPLVQGVLNDAGIGFDDLSDIVVCNGPGTFTGIRIGLSAGKTFGLVTGVPVFGVTTLQGLALSALARGVSREMLAIVETRRQDFYVQSFDVDGRAVDAPLSVMAEDINVGGRVLIGNAAMRFDPSGTHEHADVERIDVGVVARAFVERFDLFTPVPEPIYLRAPDVSQPKNKPRKIAPE